MRYRVEIEIRNRIGINTLPIRKTSVWILPCSLSGSGSALALEQVVLIIDTVVNVKALYQTFITFLGSLRKIKLCKSSDLVSDPDPDAEK
jgi:hypothetical protein